MNSLDFLERTRPQHLLAAASVCVLLVPPFFPALFSLLQTRQHRLGSCLQLFCPVLLLRLLAPFSVSFIVPLVTHLRWLAVRAVFFIHIELGVGPLLLPPHAQPHTPSAFFPPRTGATARPPGEALSWLLPPSVPCSCFCCARFSFPLRSCSRRLSTEFRSTDCVPDCSGQRKQRTLY